MARAKSAQKPKGQRPKKSGGSGGRGGFLVTAIAFFLAVPLLAAAVAWQSPLKLPDFKLEWPGATAPTAATPQRPPAKTTIPAAAPAARPEATVAAATKAPAAASTPTARSVSSVSATAVPSATPAGKIVLRVPIYRQQHAQSCEAASLRMALATFGVQMPENDLLAALARDPTPRRVVGDTVQWGDPDVGFVGSWDGAYLRDGYGVYEGPIADLAMSYGFETTKYGKGVDPKQLYASVRQGFPSVVWLPYDLTVKGRGSWVTPGGKKIPYVVTEHAVVLAGIDDRGVYYADPMKPDLQFATFSAFEKAIGELDGRFVTVRP